jgi:hypothetical protein
MSTSRSGRGLYFSITLSLGLLGAGLATSVALAGSPSPNDTQYKNPGSTEPIAVQPAPKTQPSSTIAVKPAKAKSSSIAVQPAPKTQASSTGGSTGSVAAPSNQDLPFTGQNVALFVGLGGVLLAGGLLLRRAGRKSDSG